MKNLKLSLKRGAELRLDRVSELKSHIQEGIYEVDENKLAGRMLLESLQMIPQNVKYQ